MWRLREAVSCGSSWRTEPAAELRGLANGSFPSAISRSLSWSKALANMMISPRIERNGGAGRSLSRSFRGTLAMVRTLAVIPSPLRPSPRVAACRRTPSR